MDRNALWTVRSHLLKRVALRKESVDRNAEDWINAGSLPVALRKESVDRNLNSIKRCLMSVGRSPQGERG